MSSNRVLLAGRVADDPMALPGWGGSIVTLTVPSGARSSTWAAILGPGQNGSHSLADGDAVALIGEVDPNRRSSGGLHGPMSVEAVLGLDAAGDIFRDI